MLGTFATSRWFQIALLACAVSLELLPAIIESFPKAHGAAVALALLTRLDIVMKRISK